MIHDSARRPLAARVGTGVDALVILAGAIRRAVRADRALRLATGRCTYVSRKARANGLAVALSALTVRPAGRRLARVDLVRHNRCKKVNVNRAIGDQRSGASLSLTGFDNKTAEYEWISRVSLKAGASGRVIDHVALRVLAAGARTRVLALQTDARLIGRTVRIKRALRSATLVRVADVIRRTCAGARVLLDSAHRVRAARRWRARRWCIGLYVD